EKSQENKQLQRYWREEMLARDPEFIDIIKMDKIRSFIYQSIFKNYDKPERIFDTMETINVPSNSDESEMDDPSESETDEPSNSDESETDDSSESDESESLGGWLNNIWTYVLDRIFF